MKATTPRDRKTRGPLVLNSAINAAVVFSLATLVLMVVVTGLPAQAQSFTVLHAFTGSGDGGFPNGISAIGAEGNLYGTAEIGGVTNGSCPQGCGNVFELKHSGGNWLVDSLYSFPGGNLGNPVFGITRAANGAIYGQNRGPGGADVPGLVYELTSVGARWILTVLYEFNPNGNDAYESTGEVILDAEGNIYGTSIGGGPMGAGTVYELTFTAGQWVEKDLFYFSRNGTEGTSPRAGVVLDQEGTLYGTTTGGGANGCGAVFRLTPTPSGLWNGHTLYSFPAQGGGCRTATGGVIVDAAGNVYGEVANSSPSSGVFELSPSHGGWSYTLLYGATWGVFESAPVPRLAMDSEGNLYGTTPGGTYCNPQCDEGTVFKLTLSNGRWKHTLLHEFQYDLLSGGEYPGGDLSVDSNGHLYGTTWIGGDTSCISPNGCGVAYEITP